MATAAKTPGKSGKVAKAGKGSRTAKVQKADGKDANARIKYECAMSRDEAVAYFEAIVAGLRKGAIEFKRGEEALAMSPADHVEVEVKASRKRDRETVSFEITWRKNGTADLTISAS